MPYYLLILTFIVIIIMVIIYLSLIQVKPHRDIVFETFA